MKNTTDFYPGRQDGSIFQTEIHGIETNFSELVSSFKFFCKESQHQTARHNKLWIPEAAKPSKK